MIVKELCERIKQGWKPIVRFTDVVADSDSQFEKGQMGEIVSYKLYSKDIVEFIISELNYQEYNKTLEHPIWYDNDGITLLRKSELEKRKESDSIYEDIDSNPCNFIVLQDERTRLFNQYIKERQNETYVEWLEDKLIGNGKK